MPSLAHHLLETPRGVGRNVGGALASRIATGDKYTGARDVTGVEPRLPHVDNAHVPASGGVSGDPVGVDELLEDVRTTSRRRPASQSWRECNV
jgi:hypothetical protein